MLDDTSVVDRARNAWNNEADEFNQWDFLGQDEKDVLVDSQRRMELARMTVKQHRVLHALLAVQRSTNPDIATIQIYDKQLYEVQVRTWSIAHLGKVLFRGTWY